MCIRDGAYFGLLSAALFLLALIFFIPVMATYIRTGLVPNFPTLIVCGFAVMAAIQSFFAGLILKTISRKNRQDFEIELYHVIDVYKRQGQCHCINCEMWWSIIRII